MKFMRVARFTLPAALVSLSGLSMAAGPDFTALTGAIDISTVIAAIMATALIGVGFYLAKGGALTILSFIRTIFR